MPSDPESHALSALGWILSDPRRAENFLSLTGLDVDGLRSGLGDRATLAAITGFLTNHEPDLLTCAEAIGTTPAALAASHCALAGEGA